MKKEEKDKETYKDKEKDALFDSSLKYMDYESVKEICKGNDMYETDELNEVLYLQMKGFNNINGLSTFCNLKCLFLNNNCIRKIDNLDALTNLKALYLQNNDITHIENLNCKNLLILNLSNNKIKKIENLKHLKFLQTLNISNNLIENVSDIQELADLENLTHLDVSSNNLKIGDDKNELEIASLFYDINKKTNHGNNININSSECKIVTEETNKINVEDVENEENKNLKKKDYSSDNEKERNFSEFLFFYENFETEINKNNVEEIKFYEQWENMNYITKRNFYHLCEFISLLKKIKKLKTLIIKNNPFTKEIRYITKYLMANIPNLFFLDDKRVKKEDIVLSQVFLKKGADEEKELKKIFEEKKMEKYKNLTEKFHSFLMSRENVQTD